MSNFKNLFRMTFFLIGSDIYGLKKHLRKRKRSNYQPDVSIVIPAYNEEKRIGSSLDMYSKYFDALVEDLKDKGIDLDAMEKGVQNPGALAAAIGRAKYGKQKFQEMAAAGRKKADGKKK